MANSGLFLFLESLCKPFQQLAVLIFILNCSHAKMPSTQFWVKQTRCTYKTQAGGQYVRLRTWCGCPSFKTAPSSISKMPRYFLVLVAESGWLDQLGSNPSRSKRVTKYHTSFITCYLGSTCTSKIFLFKLGLLTFYLLFDTFPSWFQFWVAQNLKKKSQVSSSKIVKSSQEESNNAEVKKVILSLYKS